MTPVRQQGKHAAARTPGPVTAAFRVATGSSSWMSHVAACAWPLIPALFLVWPAVHGQLPAYADGVLGFDATLCLAACLLVTPLVAVARVKVARMRWWYGLWVFVLGGAGLAVHFAYPPELGVAARVAGNSVNWSGMLIIVLLLPMAATSSVAAQKLLGPEWKRWQRGLMWFVWAVVGIHFAFMHAWLILGAYCGCTVPTMLLRFGRIRRSVKKWRGSGYSTGGWWLALSVLGTIAAAGLLILVEEELIAVVNAVTLTQP